MPRILCLPGYLQSGKIFAEKSSGLRKILTKKLGYQLEYLDPPILLNTKEELPFRLAAEQEKENELWAKIVEGNSNRCWWSHSGANGYEGFDEAVTYLVEHLKAHGPYDGILGFSQGAAMSVILHNCISWLVPSHPAFRIAVLFSPFAFTVPNNSAHTMAEINESVLDIEEYSKVASLNPEYEKYFRPGQKGKAIVVYGTEDGVVPPVRTQFLLRLDPSLLLTCHDGGHYVPNKKLFLNPIVESIQEALEEKPLL